MVPEDLATGEPRLKRNDHTSVMHCMSHNRSHSSTLSRESTWEVSGRNWNVIISIYTDTEEKVLY